MHNFLFMKWKGAGEVGFRWHPQCYVFFIRLSQEFGFVCDQSDIRNHFDEEFLKWAKAVLKYCKETQVNSTAIQLVLKNFSEECHTGINTYFMWVLLLSYSPTIFTPQTYVQCLHFAVWGFSLCLLRPRRLMATFHSSSDLFL